MSGLVLSFSEFSLSEFIQDVVKARCGGSFL